MEQLAAVAIRRPVLVAMAALMVLVLGGASLVRMGLDLLPDVEFPALAVVTPYPGAGPQSVEQQVTRIIEGALATAANVHRTSSVSLENLSVVIAELNWGADLHSAIRDVSENLERFRLSLPQQAQRPAVLRLDPTKLPILMLGVTAPDDPASLTQRTRKVLVPLLERVDGVGQVVVTGGTTRQVEIGYDPDRLAQARLTPEQLAQVVMLQNLEVPLGALTDGGRRVQLRAGSPLDSLDGLRQMPVSISRPGEGPLGLLPTVVRLGDVAEVEMVDRPPDGFARVNGKPSLLVSVLKESGRNTVTVSRAVARELARRGAELAGLEVVPVFDQAEFIVRSLASVTRNGAAGAVLAVAVLYAFLMHGLSTLTVAVAIPLSVVATLAFMYLSGLTLNLMSLGGLGLGVGMLVDNAIVVVESIFRHAEQGETPEAAARKGAAEVGPAIVASTLTTLVVFLPVVFVGGLAGRIFRELALTVSFSLTASLLVALTVVPVMAARLVLWERPGLRRLVQAAGGRRHARGMGDREPGGQGQDAPGSGSPGPSGRTRRGQWFESVRSRYRRALERCLRRPGWLLAGSMGLAAAVLALYPLAEVEFLTPVDAGQIGVTVEMPPGTPLETTDRVVRQVEAVLRSTPGVELVSAQVGSAGSDNLLAALTGESPFTASLFVGLARRAERPSAFILIDEIRKRLRPLVEEFPGARVRVTDSPSLGALSQLLGERVTIHVEGADREALVQLAGELVERLSHTPGFTDVTSSLAQREPALLLRVDPGRALAGGLMAGQVAVALREARLGRQVGELAMPDGQRVPIVLRARPAATDSLEGLLSLPVSGFALPGSAPPRVPAGRVVRPEPADAPALIERRDGRRVITVTAELDGIPLGEAGRRAQRVLETLSLPPGVRVQLAGIHELMAEAFSDLWLALVLAALLVYMVMAAQFESLVDPLIIMVAVPLGLAGGLAALLVTGNRVSVTAILGGIVLAGIVVNNGIVMVDYTNRLVRQGMALREAAVEAAAVRLRPVLMTTVTTILGLLPLTLGWGDAAELEVPLAVTVVGGLTVAAGLTLFVVPAARLLAGGRQAAPATASTAAQAWEQGPRAARPEEAPSK